MADPENDDFPDAAGTDSDVDSDSDADGDSDTDSDSDTDGDSDTDSDADTDGDSDTDSDADTDSNTDTTPTSSCRRYVDGENSSENLDGLSWQMAFPTIQDAIVSAASVSQCEIWIRSGIYHVFRTASSDTIDLPHGYDLHGGFSGLEKNLDERNIAANPTELDGRPFIGAALKRVDHIVTPKGNNALSGLVFSNGRSGVFSENANIAVSQCTFRDNWGNYIGGGILSRGGSLTVTDCLFENNETTSDAAAIFLAYSNSATISRSHFIGNKTQVYGGAIMGNGLVIEDSTFTGNSGQLGGAVYTKGSTIKRCEFYENSATEEGGALSSHSYSDPVGTTVKDCIFERNTAQSGGAIHMSMEYVTIENSSFVSNESEGYGGAVYCGEKFTIENCYFANNHSSEWGGGGIAAGTESAISSVTSSIFLNNTADKGGGIIAYGHQNILVSNCTFSGNTATEKGGGVCVGYDEYSKVAVTVVNSIFGNNQSPTEPDIAQESEFLQISYSALGSGSQFDGEGIITSDPMIFEGDDGIVRLQPGSPCIDSGDGSKSPELDYEGNPRIDDTATDNSGIGSPDFTDLGAVEFHSQ